MAQQPLACTKDKEAGMRKLPPQGAMETQAQERKSRSEPPLSQLPAGKETNEDMKKCGVEPLKKAWAWWCGTRL